MLFRKHSVAVKKGRAHMDKKLIQEIDAVQYWKNKKPASIREKTVNDIILEIRVKNCCLARLLTIDDDLRYLALGTLYLSNNIPADDLVKYLQIDGACAYLDMENAAAVQVKSCCCTGKEADSNRSKIIENNSFNIIPDFVFSARKYFEEYSALFRDTAGVHGAVLMNSNNKERRFFKDIARHNCISKIAGFLIADKKNRTQYAKSCLFISSRVNGEIVKMIDRTGIKIVLTKAAPSALGVKEACERGITLIGFIKEKRFTVFSGKERLDE